MGLDTISVTVLAKNSEKYLEQVLQSVEAFGEVIVYDTGSTDSTLDIAGRFPNVRIVEGSFEGFGATHNRASSLAKNCWILSVDSDEIVTPELVEEIKQTDLCEDAVYSIRRNNYYKGKWVKWCGWYPDRQYKLYNRDKTQYSHAKVHESIETVAMQSVRLEAPVIHYPYSNVSDFLDKMQRYSDLFAEQNAGKRKSSIFTAIWRGLFTFFKSYILKRGFLGGAVGWEISFYNGLTAYYKYLKLAEINGGQNQ